MKNNINTHRKNIHPESDYQELNRLGKKLGIPVLNVHICLEVLKAGIITDRYEDRSRTWNRNFWNACLVFFSKLPGVVTNFGAGYISFKNTAAAVPALTGANLPYNPEGVINNSTYGIQVGIGNAAESFEGFVLSNPVVNGSGGGQLVYAAHSTVTQNYVSGTKTWTATLKRIMNNNSGGAIVIAETALTYTAPNGTYYVFSRDLLGATVNVAIGAQLTVSYAMSLTLPA